MPVGNMHSRFLLLFCLITAASYAQQPGDIAIIGMNADNPDEFAFVVLDHLNEGVVLYFTDNGWQDSGSFRDNEGTYSYSVPAGGLIAGSVIIIESPSGPAFSSSGDQILVYIGSESSPTFIYAMNGEGDAEWQSSATSSNTSALPLGLTNGITAVALEEFDNLAYDGATTGSREELLEAIGTPSNWTGSNSSRLAFKSVFTVTGSTGNNAPFFTSVLPDTAIVSGEQFSFTYEASDIDGDALSFSPGTDGLPAGSLLASESGLLTWMPTEGQIGQTFTVSLEVTDGVAIATTSALITILDPASNQPPRPLNAVVGDLVAQGDLVTLMPSFVDPDGDSITYSLLSGPQGVSIESNTGLVTWRANADLGIYSIKIAASDGIDTSTLEAWVAVQGALFEGLSGASLRNAINDTFSPQQTLGYGPARDTLYARIAADENGFVEGIYSGFRVQLDLSQDPSTFLFNNGINAEHVWPQSKGAGDEPQRSDMHILYPANASVNSARSNLPFGEVQDDLAMSWYYLDQNSTSRPNNDVDLWSEASGFFFEPREAVKGDVARALVYFWTAWNEVADEQFMRMQWFDTGLWTERDPPSVAEVRRAGLIARYQGNINPFVIDPELALRVLIEFFPVANEEAPDAGFRITRPYPNPSSEWIRLRIANPLEINMKVFDLLGRQVLEVKAKDRVPIDVSDLAPGIYFIRAKDWHSTFVKL